MLKQDGNIFAFHFSRKLYRANYDNKNGTNKELNKYY